MIDWQEERDVELAMDAADEEYELDQACDRVWEAFGEKLSPSRQVAVAEHLVGGGCEWAGDGDAPYLSFDLEPEEALHEERAHARKLVLTFKDLRVRTAMVPNCGRVRVRPRETRTAKRTRRAGSRASPSDSDLADLPGVAAGAAA